MTIIETLKNWADVELKLLDKKPDLINYNHRMIIRWFFFGSCDICAQGMELDDKEFQYFYKELLNYIGIKDEEIDKTIRSWMLDEINEKEYFIINQGAHGFKSFENSPNGVGGLKLCFSEFSERFSPKEKI